MIQRRGRQYADALCADCEWVRRGLLHGVEAQEEAARHALDPLTRRHCRPVGYGPAVEKWVAR